MTFNELVRSYRSLKANDVNTPVTLTEAKEDVKRFMTVLVEALTSDVTTNLEGVGLLKVRTVRVPERKFYNPDSGAVEVKKEHVVVKSAFKPCPDLQQAVLLAAGRPVV